MDETRAGGSSSLSLALVCEEEMAGFGDDISGWDEEEIDEYVRHLVTKEIGFCSSFGLLSAVPACLVAGADLSAAGDLSLPVRRETVKWILQIRATFGFSLRSAYMAVSYLDRFCTKRRFDSSATPLAARLMAVACVSLAAKMEDHQADALLEFRRSDEYTFTAASIRRMELLVLSTLGWRMCGVTPFDYLPCLSFWIRMCAGLSDICATKALCRIFSFAEAASVVEHRPSTVALVAVLAPTHGAFTLTDLESKMIRLSLPYTIDKLQLEACHRMMTGAAELPLAVTKNQLKRPSPPTSEPVVSAESIYESVIVQVSSCTDGSSMKKARADDDS